MGKRKKKYFDERSRRIGKKKKRKKGLNGYTPRENGRVSYNVDYYICERIAPSTFSFQNNLKETVDFFSDTIDELERGGFRKQFELNLQDVKFVTTDVVMYLIAIMRNVKVNARRQYSFKGYYPGIGEVRKTFEESGFLKFVKSKSKRLPPNTEKLQIICGKRSLGEDARRICDFVMDKFSKDRIYTQKLYSVLIEMMSNVYFHAYTNDDIMKPMWYMYAEYTGEEIEVMFLDTGMGIANTVQKHGMYEKVVRRFGSSLVTDSKLIVSALNGEFRTKTEKENRGKGLPMIKEFALSDICQKFSVLSGKGYCKIGNGLNNKIESTDIKNGIYGTIYMFRIINSDREVYNED